MSPQTIELLTGVWTTGTVVFKAGLIAQATAILIALPTVGSRLGTRVDSLVAPCLVLPVLWVQIEVVYRNYVTTWIVILDHVAAPWPAMFAQGYLMLAVTLCLHIVGSLIAARPVFRGLPVPGLIFGILALALDTFFTFAVLLHGTDYYSNSWL